MGDMGKLRITGQLRPSFTVAALTSTASVVSFPSDVVE